jgi:hypothetical protein
MRNPFEPLFARRLPHSDFKRRLQVALLNQFKPNFEKLAAQIPSTDGTIGISTTGNLNPTTLRQVLKILPSEGTFELVCHPGYNDEHLARMATRLRAERGIEREALLAGMPEILSQPYPPQLIHYGDLAK